MAVSAISALFPSDIRMSFYKTSLSELRRTFKDVTVVGGDLKKEELVQLLGNANEFKEGDLSVGVGTDDEVCRADAKQTLSRVRLIDIFSCDIIEDQLTEKLKYRFTVRSLHIAGKPIK